MTLLSGEEREKGKPIDLGTIVEYRKVMAYVYVENGFF